MKNLSIPIEFLESPFWLSKDNVVIAGGISEEYCEGYRDCAVRFDRSKEPHVYGIHDAKDLMRGIRYAQK